MLRRRDLSQQPGLWNDPKKAEELLKRIAQLKSWTTDFEKINTAIDDLVVLNDFLREGEASEEDVDNQYNNCLSMIEDLEVRNMLQKEEDQLGSNTKDQFRSRRNRKQRLGCNAYEDVSPMGRKKQL